MLRWDLAEHLAVRERLESEERAVRFMPMADAKDVRAQSRRLQQMMERTEKWFYGESGKLARWYRKQKDNAKCKIRNEVADGR